MTQLLLDIAPPPAASLDNFIPGRNTEVLAQLHRLARTPLHNSESLYLWGNAGCGRSHLLNSMCSCWPGQNRQPSPSAHALTPATLANPELTWASGTLLVVDDVHLLDAQAQVGLFRICNAAAMAGWTLLLAGSAPPQQLALRPDLCTRLGQALVMEIHVLMDAEKRLALSQHAQAQGMTLDANLLDYLLNHTCRDIRYLMAAVDALAQLTLQQHRLPTLPLLKDALALLAPPATPFSL